MKVLHSTGFVPGLKEYIASGRHFMGICVGLQALFESSEEDPGIPGIGIIPGELKKFDAKDKAVPHIGWNSATAPEPVYGLGELSKYYYVHSYAGPAELIPKLEQEGWTVARGKYGDEEFIGAVAKGNVFATQFHPEKSGVAGLRAIKSFLDQDKTRVYSQPKAAGVDASTLTEEEKKRGGLTRRIIACLDVRTNDQGDLVVTKGDQYDVREKGEGNAVRNLGKPVQIAEKYFQQGADEVTFLNITSFRDCP